MTPEADPVTVLPTANVPVTVPSDNLSLVACVTVYVATGVFLRNTLV